MRGCNRRSAQRRCNENAKGHHVGERTVIVDFHHNCSGYERTSSQATLQYFTNYTTLLEGLYLPTMQSSKSASDRVPAWTLDSTRIRRNIEFCT
jgi:hypothetical protein